MPRIGDRQLQQARTLRRDATAAERALWDVLRDRQLEGFHFRRQHSIPPYIVDFACLKSKLIIEVDGGQHAESTDDQARNDNLRQRGWRILRFWNNDVLSNREGVLHRLLEALQEPPPRPSPGFARRGSKTPTRASYPLSCHKAGEGRGGGSSPLLPRATSVTLDGPSSDTITLPYDDRHRRRLRLTTDSGLSFLLDLPEARCLRDGDRLLLDDGRCILVRAAPEPVLDIRAPDALALTRIAWHLGNRHTPTQILDGALRIRADHVLEYLLVDHLGAKVTHTTAPFDPEGGAYGHGAVYGHDHPHHHDH